MPALLAPTAPGTLTDLMRRSGHNQHSLAKACDTSQATVSRWVNGKQSPRYLGHRTALARALGITEAQVDDAYQLTATLRSRNSDIPGYLCRLMVAAGLRSRHILDIRPTLPALA